MTVTAERFDVTGTKRNYIGPPMPDGITEEQREQAVRVGDAIREAAFHLHGCYHAKGFQMETLGNYPARMDVMERICLIHTEASEMAQEVKRHWPYGKEPTPEVVQKIMREGADTVIRTLNLMSQLGGFDGVRDALAFIHASNWLRPVRYNTAEENNGAQ